MSKKPSNCNGRYVPWVCGTCRLKMACKPSMPTLRTVDKRKKVSA